MAFKWEEFLELARDLLGKHSGSKYSKEALERTAVSRAYYAVFCRTRNYAEKKLGFKATHFPEDHGALIDHLKNLGGKWGVMANKIGDLRGWRNNCDYDDSIANLSDMVKNAIKLAESALKIIQKSSP